MSSNSRGLPRPAAPSMGVTWGGVPFNARQVLTVAAATLVVAGLAGPATANAATPSASVAERASVIVRELPGAGNAAETGSPFGGRLDAIPICRLGWIDFDGRQLVRRRGLLRVGAGNIQGNDRDKET